MPSRPGRPMRIPSVASSGRRRHGTRQRSRSSVAEARRAGSGDLRHRDDPRWPGRSACGSWPCGPGPGPSWRRRCARREISDEVIAEVLDRYDEVGIIDDAAFARAWVSSRHHGRGLARRALANELRQRGVDAEVGQRGAGRARRRTPRRRRRARWSIASCAPRTGTPDAVFRRLVGMLARKGYPAGRGDPRGQGRAGGAGRRGGGVRRADRRRRPGRRVAPSTLVASRVGQVRPP